MAGDGACTAFNVMAGLDTTDVRVRDLRGNKCSTWRDGRFDIVMLTKVSIHVFPCSWQQKRGWPDFAGHDEVV
jgi:hypothetical protein